MPNIMTCFSTGGERCASSYLCPLLVIRLITDSYIFCFTFSFSVVYFVAFHPRMFHRTAIFTMHVSICCVFLCLPPTHTGRWAGGAVIVWPDYFHYHWRHRHTECLHALHTHAHTHAHTRPPINACK